MLKYKGMIMKVSKIDNNINFKAVTIKVHYGDFRNKGTNVLEEIKSATKKIQKKYANTNLKFDIRKGFKLKKIIKALFVDGFCCAKTSKAEDIVSGADEAVKDLISEEKIYNMPITKVRFSHKKDISSKFEQFNIKNC